MYLGSWVHSRVERGHEPSRLVGGHSSVDKRDCALGVSRHHACGPDSGLGVCACNSWRVGVAVGRPLRLEVTLEGCIFTRQQEGPVALCVCVCVFSLEPEVNGII